VSLDVVTCPECGEVLTIDAPGLTRPSTMSATEFMALPFRQSASARWVCASHGEVGNVVVAVIDEDVAFVPIG